jgi:hypothetical protein
VIYNLISENRSVGAPAAEQSNAEGAEPNINPEDIRRSLARQTRNFEHRWKLTVKEIEDAISASQTAGVQIILLYLPSRWEVFWEQLQVQHNLPGALDIDRLRRTVVEYCGSRKIPCFDLTPVLKREAQQGKQLYFRIDGHWNKEGNRIVADALQKFLTEKGLAG